MSDMGQDMSAEWKEFEEASESVLESKLPVFVRLDGNSFSKLTSTHFEKPFDALFDEAMNRAAVAVLQYCAGAQLAYVQSDEMTVVLRNDQKDTTDPFLGNRTQKLASLLAATASVHFNEALRELTGKSHLAVFDARSFTVPNTLYHVNGCLNARQRDCYRNTLGSALYWTMRQSEGSGRKQAARWMHGKKVRELLPKLAEFGVTKETLGDHKLYGRVFTRNTYECLVREAMPEEKFRTLVERGHLEEDEMTMRHKWEVMEKTPRFEHDPAFVAAFFDFESE
jgi:tRNA(His) 5'-end guanylyltransferase